MFCCFPFRRRSITHSHSDEKKPLITSETTKIKYQTIITIPYAHVLRDDKIQIESSDVIETKSPAAYFLLDGTISDQDYKTTCFSFDDADVSTPVVISTRTTTGHILFERLYQIEHVTAINPSSTIRMHPIPTARPFDEFSTEPPDVQNDNNVAK